MKRRGLVGEGAPQSRGVGLFVERLGVDELETIAKVYSELGVREVELEAPRRWGLREAVQVSVRRGDQGEGVGTD